MSIQVAYQVKKYWMSAVVAVFWLKAWHVVVQMYWVLIWVRRL